MLLCYKQETTTMTGQVIVRWTPIVTGEDDRIACPSGPSLSGMEKDSPLIALTILIVSSTSIFASYCKWGLLTIWLVVILCVATEILLKGRFQRYSIHCPCSRDSSHWVSTFMGCHSSSKALQWCEVIEAWGFLEIS